MSAWASVFGPNREVNDSEKAAQVAGKDSSCSVSSTYHSRAASLKARQTSPSIRPFVTFAVFPPKYVVAAFNQVLYVEAVGKAPSNLGMVRGVSLLSGMVA